MFCKFSKFDFFFSFEENLPRSCPQCFKSLHTRKLYRGVMCHSLVAGECVHYDAHSCIGNINGFYRTLARARAKYKREGVV